MDFNQEYLRWFNAISAQDKLELSAIQNDEKEKAERFSMPLAFGTAGMRGIIGIGTYRMNVYTVKRATLGLAKFLQDLGANECKKGVVISYDTRIMSYEFALAAARVLSNNKINVYMFENVRPVPFCSFAVGHLKAAAGIMITASHNPKEYNGYKVYGADGAQMSPENTKKVVEYIEACDYFGIEEDDITIKERQEIMSLDGEKISDYITIIGKSVDEAYYSTISALMLSKEAVKNQNKSLRIVYTPIHGTGYIPVTTMLTRMGIPYDLVEEQKSPDGNFPTVTLPNPENPDALALGIRLANNIGADVVIGTDPDADRMGVAIRNNDGDFVLLTGNQTGALLADYILRRHTEIGDLPKNAAIVKTIVTTSLAKKIAESYGATCFDVLTGFKFIGEKINTWAVNHEHTFMFGYEESYGYLAGTHAKDKDAIVSATLFAEMVCYYKDIGVSLYNRLQELYKAHGYYVEKSKATTFPGLDGMRIMAEKMDNLGKTKIDKFQDFEVDYTMNLNNSTKSYSDGRVEKVDLPKSNVYYYALKSGDWVCARPSGTEPKLKVYVSCMGKDLAEAENKATILIKALQEKLTA